jgi:aryl-alcohol dehydrogenase-like predicted oxidoreductase
VITGASRASQVVDNMGALEVLEVFTPELKQRVDAAIAK